MRFPRTVAATIVLPLLCSLTARAQEQGRPGFRSEVELLSVDVTVVDGQSRPVTGLAAAEFSVFINGAARRVVSAEWVPLDAVRSTAPAVIAPEGYSSNAMPTSGRLIVLAIDQPSIRFGGGRPLIDTLNRFIDRLSPSDRVAVVPLGRGTALGFTADHNRIKQTVARLEGQRPLRPRSTFNLSISAAFALERSGYDALIATLLEQCPLMGKDPEDTRDRCLTEIDREKTNVIQEATQQRDATIRALSDVLSGLASIDAAKSLVLISEGLPLHEDDGEVATLLTALGTLAAAAHTTIYALHLDERLFESQQADRAITLSPASDAQILAGGLARLSQAARGALFTVIGSGEAAFDRIQSELSGYYLLGIQSAPGDDGQTARPLRVEVARKGATVRANMSVSRSPALTNRSPQQAVAAALANPLLVPTLPLRVTTLTFEDPDPSKLQVLIHADVGQAYTGPQNVAAAYIITDASGRVVESQSLRGRLAPPFAGVASPLSLAAGASLPAGDYTLKLAVADGAKIGSVEHAFRVSLIGEGALKVSDLGVGGPLPSRAEPLRPTVDDTVRFGIVHGYMEVYGSGATNVRVRYEVAVDDASPALLEEDVPGRVISDSRVLFTRLVSTVKLPPGRYKLRALVTAGDALVQKVSRGFEVEEAVAKSTGLSAATPQPDFRITTNTELFLPVSGAELYAPFRVADALQPDTLQSLRASVPTPMQEFFADGVDALRRGDYGSAEANFKRMIRPDNNVSSALAYLAVCYAATKHDADAAATWQTALVGAKDQPQIFRWLGQTLLRTGDGGRAQAVLEEATTRWPADRQFVRLLAIAYATSGKGHDAIQKLQEYLMGEGDVDALYLGLEWIYRVHVAGGVVVNRDADLELARSYAERYARAEGPKQGLVTQWLNYLAKP